MPTIFLVRHGEADSRRWSGAVFDLAPLTPKGVDQAAAVGRELQDVPAHRIVASPMTRALQTASLIAAETRLPLAVEFDLREWLPDDTFAWRSFEDVLAAGRDFEECKGEWPVGETRSWEPLSAVRDRALAACLRRHTASRAEPLIAVCHGMVIQALTGHNHTDLCEVRTVDVTADAPSPSA
jgi:broad specificity phosphatase PhoE